MLAQQWHHVRAHAPHHRKRAGWRVADGGGGGGRGGQGASETREAGAGDMDSRR